MTVRRSLSLAIALVALPSVGAAQQPVSCTVTGPVVVRGYVADACQKATDLFSFIMPQFGQAFAGGGAIVGSANTLGGLGKVSFNVRVSAVQGRVPDLDDIRLSAAGAQRSQIGTTDAPVPAPVVDVGVGLYKGFPVGVTRLFSVDGLVNVAYLPDVDVEDISVLVPGGRFKFGYGARVGITRDGPMMPAVSVSFIRRDLPTADINASFDGGSGARDQISLTGFAVSSDALRASVSKKLAFLELGGGVGRDTYNTRLNIGAVVNEAGATGTAAYSYTQQVKRNVVYGSLAFNFPVVKLAAEVGQASGGTVLDTFNTFVDGGQNEARRFASVGVRVSF